MKCSIIRDLLPLYELNKCRAGTREIVSNHLKACESCRELYDTMKDEIGLKDSVKVKEKPNADNDFWRRYYGSLIIKGLGIFILIYGILIIFNIIKYN